MFLPNEVIGLNPANIVRIMGQHSAAVSLEHYYHASQDAMLRSVDLLAKMRLAAKESTKESTSH